MELLIMIVLALTAALLFLSLYVVLKLGSRKEKFEKDGIPYYFVSSVGNSLKFMVGSMNIVQFEEKMYQVAVQCDAPIVIESDFPGEIFVVTDLDLIKSILVKDFDNFVNGRKVETQQTNKYFKKMLFAMEDEQWRVVRHKLSPSFSSGRIRRMFQIFQTSSARTSKYLAEQIEPVQGAKDFNLSLIASKFTMDVIASCGFGIDGKTWDVKPHEQSYFEKMGTKYTIQTDFKSMLKLFVIIAAPQVADLLGFQVMDSESENYFCSILKDVIKIRRQSPDKRDDFLQLMLEAQQDLLKTEEDTKNGVGDEGSEEATVSSEDLSKVMFNDDDVIANALLFLVAGFDNILSVIIFTLYNLALVMDVQERLYEEVTEVLSKHRDKLSYEAVSDMTYLESVIHETMRVYPPVTRTERTCTQDYTVPGTSFVIEKGSLVLIPLLGIQRDARYFPEPQKFNPERFTQENKSKRHPYSYLPFGLGPRRCIGIRFAILQVKIVLAQLVRDFHFEPCARTRVPMEFDKDATIKPKGGMWLSVRCREQ